MVRYLTLGFLIFLAGGGVSSSYVNLCRSSSRTRDVPTFTRDKVGLRLVLVGSR